MGELKVRELMTTEVITLQPTDTVKRAVAKYAVDNISGMPVVDNKNHLLGFISQNDILDLIMRKLVAEEREVIGMDAVSNASDVDLLKAISEDISNVEVSNLMVRTVLITSPEASVTDVLKVMINKKISRVPVLEKGVLVGIVSRADIIFALNKKKA